VHLNNFALDDTAFCIALIKLIKLTVIFTERFYKIFFTRKIIFFYINCAFIAHLILNACLDLSFIETLSYIFEGTVQNQTFTFIPKRKHESNHSC